MIEAIVELTGELLRAFNAHDAAAFAACFTDDADFTDVVGNTVIGRPEIERLHSFPFAHVLREAKIELQKTDVRFLRPDLAVVIAPWTLTESRSRADEPLPPRRGVFHLVVTMLSLGPERWRIASAMNAELAGLYAKEFKPGETLPESSS